MKKRVSIFSPWANRMVSVKPYSSPAKKLYRYYIQEFGYDPSWIVPPDLKFGWVFQRIVTLDVHVAKYKPLKGSSWFDLPQALKLKKAIVNVKNADQQCFKWAVLSALFPANKDAQRVGKYKEHEQKLDWGGLPPEGPVTLQDIPKFERRNSASVNVYGWDEKKKGGHLLQKSKMVLNAKRHVDLLLLEQGSKTHYCWIKSFSRFARQPPFCVTRAT